MSLKYITLVLIVLMMIACGGSDESALNDEMLAEKVRRNHRKTIDLTEKIESLSNEEKNSFREAVAGKCIGIVDAGSDRKTPPALLDMVTVFLSEKRNIKLVEREDMAQILKEQALNLSMTGNRARENIVNVGKLVKADGLLMFETGAPVKKFIPVRIRLVDSHYGIKLWDEVIHLKKDLSNLQKHLALIFDRIIGKLQRADDGQPVTVVGISKFHSREFKGRMDWLSDELSAGIERQLSTRPGILLAERHKTRPLMKERELTQGLPESLRSSAVLVEGSYVIDREAGFNDVVLTLTCRSGGQEVSSVEVQGGIDSIGELCKNAADSLVEELDLQSGHPAMHRDEEANFLFTQAQIYYSLRDMERAIPVIQSAVAISPRLLNAKALFIRIVNDMSQNFHWKLPRSGKRTIPPEVRKRFLRRYIPLCLQSIEVARSMLKHPRFPQTHHYRAQGFKQNYSRQALYWLLHWQNGLYSYPDKILNLDKGDDAMAAVKTMAPGYQSLYRLYMKDTVANTTRFRYLEAAIEDGMRKGCYMYLTPEQTLEHLFTVIKTAAGEKKLPYLAFKCLSSPSWPTDTRLHRMYTGMLDTLANEDDPMMNALAERCYAQYYFTEAPVRNRTKALEHFKRFVQLMETNIIAGYQGARNMGSWPCVITIPFQINQLQQFRDRLKGYHLPEFAGLKRRLIDAFLAPGLNNTGWRLLTGDAAFWSEAAGESAEMIALLKRCKKHLDRVKPGKYSTYSLYKSEFKAKVDEEIRELRLRHPELEEQDEPDDTGAAPLVSSLTSEVILESAKISSGSGSALPSNPVMVGMLTTKNHVAVIIADGEYWGREHIGILRLNPGNFDVIGYTGLDGLKYSTNRRSSTFNMHSDHGPRRCAHEDDVFLGLFDSGIVYFPYENEPLHMTTNNGLMTDDIVSAMTVLDEKLYALVRESSLEWGLMEVDYKGKSSRILISQRGGKSDGDMQQMSLKSIIAIPGESSLLINAFPPHEENKKRFWGLYKYNPQSRKAKWLKTIWPGQYCRLEQVGEQLVFVDREKVGVLKALGTPIQWLYLQNRGHLMMPTRPGRYRWKPKDTARWMDFYEPVKCVVKTGEMLMLGAEDSGGPMSLYRKPPFHLLHLNKDREIVELKGDGFPKPENIVDMIKAGNDVLVLTRNALYKVSFLQTPDSPPGVQTLHST
ncbi:MAG: hypothetical protein GY757_34255 [bacterium]|nr:hypothetical protein [bacterium]